MKVGSLVLFLGFVLVVLFCLISPPLPPAGNVEANDVNRPEKIISRKENQPSIGHRQNPEASPAALLEAQESSSGTHDQTITNRVTDFVEGDHQNTVVTDCLRMGNDERFLCQAGPFRYFGIYTSPEKETSEPIGALVLDLKYTQAAESDLGFEYRIKNGRGEWLDWREVANFNAPILLECSAHGWQYRLIFYANDFVNSPRVASVAVTQPDPYPNLSSSSLPPDYPSAADENRTFLSAGN
ncbi:MAG TPA: hypothetical protein VFW05_06250 [Verrucomicrobiae bacterium]|nr:hypothetical protein [Verrucomicrobiae bacterium]